MTENVPHVFGWLALRCDALQTWASGPVKITLTQFVQERVSFLQGDTRASEKRKRGKTVTV